MYVNRNEGLICKSNSEVSQIITSQLIDYLKSSDDNFTIDHSRFTIRSWNVISGRIPHQRLLARSSRKHGLPTIGVHALLYQIILRVNVTHKNKLVLQGYAFYRNGNSVYIDLYYSKPVIKHYRI